ncbi:MAG: thiol peroxidase [Desulfobacteraceae bacterium]|nr:thiol peroxidase [Desulfobacteraceae bacterium]MBU4000766.1 thiol peroxidase [Pseudomonadota bacterium]
MAQITLKGNSINTSGTLPKTGENAPDFLLTDTKLADKSLKDFAGKTLILNIFPSIDTPVCSMSVRKFNAEITKFDNTAVLCISRDLPFAHARFCGAEGLNNVVSLSELRSLDFGEKYGLRIKDGPLAGLLARAVVMVDSKGKVIYTQLVPEIGEEPDYEKALNLLK